MSPLMMKLNSHLRYLTSGGFRGHHGMLNNVKYQRLSTISRKSSQLIPHNSTSLLHNNLNSHYQLKGRWSALMIHQRRPLIATEEKKPEEPLSSSETETKEDESLQLSFSGENSSSNTSRESEIVRMSAKREPPPNPMIPEVSSSQSVPSTTPETIVAATIPPPPRRKRVSILVFSKFFTFVQRYSEILTKNFPKSIKNVFQVFSLGLKDFIREMLEYGRISKRVLLATNGVRDLSGKELDVYYRMPKEMFRVAPTLLISALPFMHNVMFPIAYYFPKRLLSSHFWSLQQKSTFSIEFQKKRLLNFRPVFRSLQANVSLVRDVELKKKCQKVLDKLGSGSHPSGKEIMDIKPLFQTDPFSLKAIYGPHVKELCKMHGIHTMLLTRRRLTDRAEMLHVMDIAMIREGIFNLKTEDLKTACFIRGLNASNTSHEDMMEYLQQWCSISTSTNSHSYSLLLHLPILLGYNNPNNWALLA